MFRECFIIYHLTTVSASFDCHSHCTYHLASYRFHLLPQSLHISPRPSHCIHLLPQSLHISRHSHSIYYLATVTSSFIATLTAYLPRHSHLICNLTTVTASVTSPQLLHISLRHSHCIYHLA